MYTDTSAGALFGAIVIVYLVVLGFALLLSLALYIVTALAFQRLFSKVGIDGWIAWVPFYNTWKRLELGGQPGWLSLLSIVGASIVPAIFLCIGMWRTGIAFRKDSGFLVLGIFLPFVWAFLLARPQEEYHPEFITAAGYGPPFAGYGSMPPTGWAAPTA
jgi:Family of unknown function (DUF5684)